jgi:hypothetical protein
MIPDLAGLLGLRGRPGWRQGRQAVPRRTFDIDQCAGSQPTAGFESFGSQGQKIGVEGRIEEHDIEGAPGPPEEAQRVAMLHFGATGAPLGEAGPQLTRGGRIAFHERDVDGPPGEGLETERAAAGEQVEAPCSRHAWAEPVEEGFAYAVGRWANFGGGWKA